MKRKLQCFVKKYLKHKIVIYFLIVIFVLFIGVGYASFSRNLTLNNLFAIFRVKKDIRISGITFKGDKNANVGDTISCGNESFNVISNQGDYLLMLATKNIDLNEENPVQNTNASTTLFSLEEINNYLNAYKKYLKNNFSLNSLYINLPKIEQLIELGCSKEDNTCPSTYSFLYSTSYFTNSLENDKVWVMNNNSLYLNDDKELKLGVRPTVKFLKAELGYSCSLLKAVANSYDYSEKNISLDINLPYEDSYVDFSIDITNFGNKEMVLSSIKKLPSYLTYEISDYNLGDTICDSDDNCTLGITKTINLRIKYKNGGYDSNNIRHQFNLTFEFNPIYSVSYEGFNLTTENYPSRAIENNKLNITFKNESINLHILMNGKKIEEEICEPVNGEISFDVGAKYICKVNDTKSYTFYVIGEDSNNVSLILDKNIDSDTTSWCEGESSNSCLGSEAKQLLSSKVASWTKSEILNISLPSYNQIYNVSKSEDLTSVSWLYNNMSSTNGYWTSTIDSNTVDKSYVVSSDGVLSSKNVDNQYGIRPVITVKKESIESGYKIVNNTLTIYKVSGDIEITNNFQPCKVVTGSGSDIGDQYLCEVAPGKNYTFFVLSSDKNKVNLILDSNIDLDGNPIKSNDYDPTKVSSAWLSSEDAKNNLSETDFNNNNITKAGPLTVISNLDNATSTWYNIPSLNETYSDYNSPIKYSIKFSGKARIPSYNELKNAGCSDGMTAKTCPLWLVNYMDDYKASYSGRVSISRIGAYWTLDTYPTTNNTVWYLFAGGGFAAGDARASSWYDDSSANYNYLSYRGIRPVISIPVKSLKSQVKYSVTYSNFATVGSKFPTTIKRGNTLTVDFTGMSTDLNVYMDNKQIEEVVCTSVDSNPSFEIGKEYICNVNDKESYTFNIIGKSQDNISLILNKNIDNTSISWCLEGDDNSCLGDGIKKALEEKTNSWNNNKILSISLPTYEQIYNLNKSKELINDPWLYQNLDSGKGYWTLTKQDLDKNYAYGVLSDGKIDNVSISNKEDLGIRPIITVKKDNMAYGYSFKNNVLKLYNVTGNVSIKNNFEACSVVSGTGNNLGDQYLCEVAPGKKYTFFLLSSSSNTKNLILDSNIDLDGNPIKSDDYNKSKAFSQWISSNDAKNNLSDSDFNNNIITKAGPITATTNINNATKSWYNIPSLNETYNDYNSPSKFSIELSGKARLPKYNELKNAGCSDGMTAKTCPLWLVNYMDDYKVSYSDRVSIDKIATYWVMDACPTTNNTAWYVFAGGGFAAGDARASEWYDSSSNNHHTYRGIRPVITIFSN